MPAAVAGAVISGVVATRNAKKAREAASEARRRFGNTGFSTFDTDTGRITIDPSLRAQTGNQRLSLRALQPQATEAARTFQGGVQGIRESLAGLATEFEGSRSAFREAALAPAREQIAREEGRVSRELGRRRIFGTFGEQARAGVAATGAQALTTAAAAVERDRIATLSQFLGMDAELLQASLQSETGRIDTLTGIEQILAGLTQDEFNREITALNVASGVGEGSAALDSAAASSEGVRQQAIAQGIGNIFSAAGSGGSNAPAGGTSAAGGTINTGGTFSANPAQTRGFSGGF